MAIEVTCLLWSALLGFFHINAQVITLGLQQRGKVYDANRDHEPELGPQAGRAARAMRNFLESYPLFIALVCVVMLSGRSGMLTEWGSILYLGARVVYLPLYVIGLATLRSTFWGISFLGLAMMFGGVVFYSF